MCIVAEAAVTALAAALLRGALLIVYRTYIQYELYVVSVVAALISLNCGTRQRFADQPELDQIRGSKISGARCRWSPTPSESKTGVSTDSGIWPDQTPGMCGNELSN